MMSNAISVYDIRGDSKIAVIARFKNKTGLNAFIKGFKYLTKNK